MQTRVVLIYILLASDSRDIFSFLAMRIAWEIVCTIRLGNLNSILSEAAMMSKENRIRIERKGNEMILISFASDL